MIHELKTVQPWFDDVVSGRKSFEVRKADRPFKVGDLLALNEYNATTKSYTGASCLVYIDYILSNPQYVKSGYVILGIKPCYVTKVTEPFSYSKASHDYSVPYATRRDDYDALKKKYTEGEGK